MRLYDDWNHNREKSACSFGCDSTRLQDMDGSVAYFLERGYRIDPPFFGAMLSCDDLFINIDKAGILFPCGIAR